MTKQKIVVLSVLASLLVLGSGFLVLQKLHITHFFTNSSSQLSADEKKAALVQKAAVNNAASSQTTNSSSTSASASSTTQTTNGQSTTKSSVSTDNITLTASKTSDTSVTVYTQLKDYSDGICTLTVTNGSATNTQTAAVMYQPQYAICAGFSVPIDGLGTGTWSITLSVVSGGTTVDKTISYEVN